jgi:hypothetical protein
MDEIVRLVMKISIHHLVTCFILCACSAFEKSLRNRLLKVIYSTCNCFFSYQFCNRRKMSSQDSDSLNTFLDFSQTNPDTDYHCLTTFGSFFTKDIPLPAVIFFWFMHIFALPLQILIGLHQLWIEFVQGTTVDFRRTADGQLITESKSLLVGNLTLYMHCCRSYLAASPYICQKWLESIAILVYSSLFSQKGISFTFFF